MVGRGGGGEATKDVECIKYGAVGGVKRKESTTRGEKVNIGEDIEMNGLRN